MSSRLAGLTGATLETAPSVCQSCVWWQARGNREPEKRKWIERAEDLWGAWGTIYRDDDGDRCRRQVHHPLQVLGDAPLHLGRHPGGAFAPLELDMDLDRGRCLVARKYDALPSMQRAFREAGHSVHLAGGVGRVTREHVLRDQGLPLH